MRLSNKVKASRVVLLLQHRQFVHLYCLKSAIRAAAGAQLRFRHVASARIRYSFQKFVGFYVYAGMIEAF